MTRMFQLATLLMFILAVIGTALAQAVETPQPNAGEDEKEKILKREEAVKKKIEVVKREDILKKKKFRDLKREEARKLEKLEDRKLRILNKLDEEKLRKISRLEEKKIERLAKLEHKELRKLARLEGAELDKLAALDEAKLKKIGRLSRAEIKRLAIKNPDELAKIDFDKKIVEKDKFRREAFIKRKISKERLTRAREDFRLAKEHRMRAKNQMGDARSNFFDAKKVVAACEGVTSEECDRIKEEIHSRAKVFLLHTADIIIAELEKMQTKIQASEELKDDEVSDWLENINAEIEEVKEAKATIEAAQTKEEIIEAAQVIKKKWRFTKHHMKKLSGVLVHRKAGGIIAKAEILEERLEDILSDLEEKEIDTTEIDVLVDLFSEKIAEAKEEYELAQQNWREVKEIRSANVTFEDLREANQLLKEARDHLKAANEALREAHGILRKIFEKVKVTGAHITDPDRPDYIPGEDIGYFIWQSDTNAGIWTICLSGDRRAHTGKGIIKADDGFDIVRPFLYERKTDKYLIFDTEIAFRAWVGPHQDCLRFATASEEVTFELYIDGEQTDQIFVGKDNDQYTSPVTLEGEPCTRCIEEPEVAEVEEGYELVECTTIEDCTEEGAICSADGACVFEMEGV